MAKKWITHRAKSRRYRKKAWRQRHKTSRYPKKNYGATFFSPNRPIDKIWFNVRDIEKIKLSPDRKTIEGELSTEEVKRFELKPITDITDDTGRIDLDKFIIKHKISLDKLERKGITKRDILGELTSVDKEGDVVKTIKDIDNE